MHMSQFLVWDEFNSSREYAWEITAYDAEDAAIEYAETDVDGNCDGLYTNKQSVYGTHNNLERDGQPISVEDPDGKVTRFRVGIVELEPVYRAAEVE